MTDIRDVIAAERLELAEILVGLPAKAWDAPSLCEGWRVREVVAHMTAPYRHPDAEFLRAEDADELNRAADELARLDAGQLTSTELTAAVRDNARHPWQPDGFTGALCHDVIHGLDITVALGLGRQVPLDRLRIVLDTIVPDRAAFFGVDLTGKRLVATDLDWSNGDGEPVTRPAQELVLLVCGRT
ncbi:maleylpyruvate isomerase family mycothiol-dependent enzyme [Actinophytocola glycyrrhizae]|uniref:Maleylpyruvate isomerase family mycothiol-dependent enzyme n=1 Tax=Actinophytocola glycyrrhizae TaxID=2044873 RepID=A0ABV9S6T7_9PSEU